jgi:GntR family transcriptional repressor for pyruvate dehydrogenase complex
MKPDGDGDWAFEAVSRGSRLSDRVGKKILDAILQGRLWPGARLPTERTMAKQLDVSRPVVGAALRALISRGLIEAGPGRVLRVAALESSSAVQSLFRLRTELGGLDDFGVHEVRAALEPEIAGRAAERATAEEIQAIGEVLGRGDAGLKRDDLRVVRDADRDFHRRVVSAAHNGLWEILLNAIDEPLADIRALQTGLRGRNEAAFAEHRSVYQAIKDLDPDAARRAMASHVEATRRTSERLAAGEGADETVQSGAKGASPAQPALEASTGPRR